MKAWMASCATRRPPGKRPLPGETVIGLHAATPARGSFLFLSSAIERAVSGREADPIADNYATHKHPKGQARARHPRWTFHFTPTSCSWLNAVENFFATLTKGN